ncbi:sialoadhesin-like [Clarias gariepinus]
MELRPLCVMLLLMGLIHCTRTEKPKPVIRSSREGETLTGNSVTLTCTLNLQSADWKFYWNKDTQSTETETETSTHSHTITPVSVSDGGQYRCRAGRGNPVYYTHYSDALWVNVTEIKPVVIINPDTQVYRGERVTFRCNIQTGRDTEWTYSWYRNDYTQNPHRTTQEFTVNITGQDWSYYGGKYTCRGTRRSDSQISEMSEAVLLSVSEKLKPTVRVNPQRSIYTGDRVTLSCDLKGPGWTFHWDSYQQSRHLTSVDTQSKTLTVTESNVGEINYYCKALRGNYESDYSNAALITVRARPQPVVKVQPAESVFTGESVTLTCEIQTGGSWQYHWYRDTTKLLQNPTGANKYTISKVTKSNEGAYTCKGTQSSDPKYTETSAAVTLTVSVIRRREARLPSEEDLMGEESEVEDDTEYNPRRRSLTLMRKKTQLKWSPFGQKMEPNPLASEWHSENPKPVITSSRKGETLTGNPVTLTCTLKLPSADWKFYWKKERPSKETETSTDSHTITPVRVSDGGHYWCRAGRGDPVYYTHYSDALWVNVIEKPKPVITSSRKGETLTGNSVTLTCTLKLPSADWKFYWKKERQSKETETSTHSNTITPVRVSDGGQYKCRAGRGDPVYYTNSSDALWVNVIEIKPVVIINPDTQVYRGERVTFRCNIQTGGDTEWTYRWYKNDNTQTPHSTTQEFTVDITGQDWSYYGGKYTCSGTRRSDSQISEMSEAVTLSVSEKPKPELTSDLKGAALTGNSVTLTCRLKLPSAGWKFYWTKDKQTTETVTGTFHYFIRSVSVSDEGQYRCRAGRGNPVYYTHYSDALWVNVTDGDVILESPVHPVTEGNPLTLRCLYRNTNISDSDADFYKDGSVLQKQTTGEMTISSVLKSDEGFYHCTHPERGESPKSWVSVRASGFPVVIVALSSAFALFLLMILLIVLVRSKKKKGVEYQTPSAVILDTNQPTGGENVYENTDSKTTDATAEPENVTYAEIELKKQKKPKKKPGKSSKGDETVYSELKQDTDKGKSSEGDDNLYSEVKKNTDKDAAPGPSVVTCAKPEVMKKDDVPGPPPLPSDLTCVKPELIKLKDPKKNQDVAPGPSDVTCVKPEVMKKPKKNQDAAPGPSNVPKTELKKLNPGKSSDGAGDMFSELKRAMEKKSQMSSLKK